MHRRIITWLGWHGILLLALSGLPKKRREQIVWKHEGGASAQYISLKPKRRKQQTRKLQIWHTARNSKNTKELSMYRVRQMELDDKVCEQVSMTMLHEVYPKEVVERCVQQSAPWSSKARRVRASTALGLVLFLIGM